MDGKIGILCAGDDELAPFLPLIGDCVVSEKAMLKFYSGKIQGIEIAALFSGVCKTNAAVASQLLIDFCGCSAIVNAGTAGGMDPELKRFDTVISTESAYWDVSADILTEFHPWMDTVYLPADQKLLALAQRAVAQEKIPNVFFGRMITGEAFIKDTFRSRILRDFAPLSVDMETAAAAHVCYVNRIPFIAVRTITDTAEHCGVDEFELNCKKASQISASIVEAMLRAMPG